MYLPKGGTLDDHEFVLGGQRPDLFQESATVGLVASGQHPHPPPDMAEDLGHALGA